MTLGTSLATNIFIIFQAVIWNYKLVEWLLSYDSYSIGICDSYVHVLLGVGKKHL